MASFDIGIDLGTTKIMICRSDKGVVLNEPSIVAYNKKTEEVVAVINIRSEERREGKECRSRGSPYH